MDPELHFRDKFIAFVDILGFKSKVEAAERGDGLTLSQLLELCSELSQISHSKNISEYGPIICPKSRCESRQLDYTVTQVSDCAVISTEVSPAGIVNLLQHISACVFGLMTKGIMVRGYISRGNVFHCGNQILGTAYQTSLEKERQVVAFRLASDQCSTPFVEVDPRVVTYIKTETDSCVREMFRRMVKVDENGIAVVFPFDKLVNLVGGNFGDTREFQRSLRIVREWIQTFKERLESEAPHSSTEANQKVKYYRKFLDEQLKECNKLESDHLILVQPSVRIRHSDIRT